MFCNDSNKIVNKKYHYDSWWIFIQLKKMSALQSSLQQLESNQSLFTQLSPADQLNYIQRIKLHLQYCENLNKPAPPANQSKQQKMKSQPKADQKKQKKSKTQKSNPPPQQQSVLLSQI